MHTQLIKFFRVLILISSLILQCLCTASAAGASKEDDGKPKFIDIKPSLVSNFIADKIRFVKADIVLKVKDVAHVELVQSQMPLVKHQLLMMLASQHEENLVTPEGQANLKAQALEELNGLLEEELGEPAEIMEVLFIGFLVE